MKKFNFLNKTAISLLMLSMSLSTFTGCQNKTVTQAAPTSSSTEATAPNKTKLTPDEMKKQMQDSIQPLVTDGTITQAQQDKILETLSQRPAGQKKSQDTPSSTDQTKQQDKKQNGTQNSDPNNKDKKQRTSPLTKLVTDNTITQAQADAVMQKIKGNFTGGKNNPSSGS